MRGKSVLLHLSVGALAGCGLLLCLALLFAFILGAPPFPGDVDVLSVLVWALSFALSGALVGVTVAGSLGGAPQRGGPGPGELHGLALLDSLGESLVVIDRDYRIVLANRAYRELGGVAAGDDVRGMSCYSVSHGRDRPCHEEGECCPLEEVFRTGKEYSCLHVHGGAGDGREVEVAAYPVRDRSGRLLHVVEAIRAVPKSKSAEEKLRKSEEKFRTLFDTSSEAIFILDEAGNFLDVNRTAHERLGYGKQEMLGMNVADIDPPEYASQVPERMARLVREGSALFESAHRCRDGTVMPVEINAATAWHGGRQVVFSFVRDLTARKAEEERLRESEKKYSALFRESGDAVFLHDMAGNIVDVNEKALAILGYAREEIDTLKVGDLHPPSAREASAEAFADIVREGSAAFEISFRRKDGSVFPAEVSSRLLDVGGGDIVQGVVRDISERRAAEEKARDYARRLEHTNDLKDLFADILSHDLQNPASIVAHAAELLSKREHLRDAREVSMIQRNARRIMQLIEDASIYAKMESGGAPLEEEIELVTALSARMASFRSRFEEKRIVVDFDHPPSALVSANPLVELIFDNLLSNAAKYSPEDSRVKVGLQRQGKGWLLTVADEGEGVPGEFRQAIFGRFERRDKKGVKGTGLGLAIVKRVTELHGGTVGVDPRPGGGSIFRVWLPDGR